MLSANAGIYSGVHCMASAAAGEPHTHVNPSPLGKWSSRAPLSSELVLFLTTSLPAIAFDQSLLGKSKWIKMEDRKNSLLLAARKSQIHQKFLNESLWGFIVQQHSLHFSLGQEDLALISSQPRCALLERTLCYFCYTLFSVACFPCVLKPKFKR